VQNINKPKDPFGDLDDMMGMGNKNKS